MWKPFSEILGTFEGKCFRLVLQCTIYMYTCALAFNALYNFCHLRNCFLRDFIYSCLRWLTWYAVDKLKCRPKPWNWSNQQQQLENSVNFSQQCVFKRWKLNQLNSPVKLWTLVNVDHTISGWFPVPNSVIKEALVEWCMVKVFEFNDQL